MKFSKQLLSISKFSAGFVAIAVLAIPINNIVAKEILTREPSTISVLPASRSAVAQKTENMSQNLPVAAPTKPTGLALFVELLKALTPFVTIIGIGIGLKQYSQAQSWKRMEFASLLVRRVTEEQTLSLATLLIDWKHRKILLPDGYKCLDLEHESDSTNSFDHSYAEMHAAFSSDIRETIPETNRLEIKESEIDLRRTVYIDSFDRLFEYFQEVGSFLAMRLIKANDIDLLAYWAGKILHTKYNGSYIFRWYLSYYDLWGVFSVASAGINGKLFIFCSPLDQDRIKFHLANGMRIVIPVAYLTGIEDATAKDLALWEILDDGKMISLTPRNIRFTVQEILKVNKRIKLNRLLCARSGAWESIPKRTAASLSDRHLTGTRDSQDLQQS